MNPPVLGIIETAVYTKNTKVYVFIYFHNSLFIAIFEVNHFLRSPVDSGVPTLLNLTDLELNYQFRLIVCRQKICR